MHDPAFLQPVVQEITQVNPVIPEQYTVELYLVTAVLYKIFVITDGHREAVNTNRFFCSLVDCETPHFKIVFIGMETAGPSVTESGDIKRRIVHFHKTDQHVTRKLFDQRFQFRPALGTVFPRVKIYA